MKFILILDWVDIFCRRNNIEVRLYYDSLSFLSVESIPEYNMEDVVGRYYGEEDVVGRYYGDKDWMLVIVVSTRGFLLLEPPYFCKQLFNFVQNFGKN